MWVLVGGFGGGVGTVAVGGGGLNEGRLATVL